MGRGRVIILEFKSCLTDVYHRISTTSCRSLQKTNRHYPQSTIHCVLSAWITTHMASRPYSHPTATSPSLHSTLKRRSMRTYTTFARLIQTTLVVIAGTTRLLQSSSRITVGPVSTVSIRLSMLFFRRRWRIWRCQFPLTKPLSVGLRLCRTSHQRDRRADGGD